MESFLWGVTEFLQINNPSMGHLSLVQISILNFLTLILTKFSKNLEILIPQPCEGEAAGYLTLRPHFRLHAEHYFWSASQTEVEPTSGKERPLFEIIISFLISLY